MVHIITDTTACLPADIAERHHIPVIPQILVLGSESFKEGSEIDHATFMQWLRTSSEMPKTAAPPPELFIEESSAWLPPGSPFCASIHPMKSAAQSVPPLSRRRTSPMPIFVLSTRARSAPP